MVRETFAELVVAFPQDSKSPYLLKLLCHQVNYFLLSYIPKTKKCQTNKKQASGNGMKCHSGSVLISSCLTAQKMSRQVLGFHFFDGLFDLVRAGLSDAQNGLFDCLKCKVTRGRCGNTEPRVC